MLQDLKRRIENQPGTELAFFYFTFSDAYLEAKLLDTYTLLLYCRYRVAKDS
jgi:hypothetical protein